MDAGAWEQKVWITKYNNKTGKSTTIWYQEGSLLKIPAYPMMGISRKVFDRQTPDGPIRECKADSHGRYLVALTVVAGGNSQETKFFKYDLVSGKWKFLAWGDDYYYKHPLIVGDYIKVPVYNPGHKRVSGVETEDLIRTQGRYKICDLNGKFIRYSKIVLDY